jgi:DNA invertase Pin-like site-specific DNA recombinase
MLRGMVDHRSDRQRAGLHQAGQGGGAGRRSEPGQRHVRSSILSPNVRRTLPRRRRQFDRIEGPVATIADVMTGVNEELSHTE